MKPVALAFAALMLSLPIIAVAAPVVFEASGASPSDILATVNAFRTFLGANNGVGGSFPDGRREINWDGVPDAFAAPNSFPANFFNFKPWAAAVEFLLGKGIECIRDHDEALVEHFIAGLDPDRFEVLSPRQKGLMRSTLVFFSHRDHARNHAIHAGLSQAGIDIAVRGGLLRVSPHLHNSSGDITRTLGVLNESS